MLSGADVIHLREAFRALGMEQRRPVGEARDDQIVIELDARRRQPRWCIAVPVGNRTRFSRPDTVIADAKPAVTKPAVTKPATDAKPATKPKKGDDLFDTRH